MLLLFFCLSFFFIFFQFNHLILCLLRIDLFNLLLFSVLHYCSLKKCHTIGLILNFTKIYLIFQNWSLCFFSKSFLRILLKFCFGSFILMITHFGPIFFFVFNLILGIREVREPLKNGKWERRLSFWPYSNKKKKVILNINRFIFMIKVSVRCFLAFIMPKKIDWGSRWIINSGWFCILELIFSKLRITNDFF